MQVPPPPEFPVVLLPPLLQEALTSRPNRETFPEPEPVLPEFTPPLGLRITTTLMRLFGQRKQAELRLEQARKPLLEQHEQRMQAFLLRKADFETQEDQKFTPEALQDHRKKRTFSLLEASVPEVGREGYAPLGFAEDFFLEHLQEHFEGRIGRHFQVGSNHSRGFEYVPDFVYFDPRFNLRICIEIDEPYTTGKKAIHHTEYQEGQQEWVSSDHERDQHFLELGWAVVRFSEQQVLTDPVGCCKVVQQLIEQVTLEKHGALERVSPVAPHPRWDRQTANLWAETEFRKTYQQGITASRQVEGPAGPQKPEPEPSEHQKAIYQFAREGNGHGLVLAVAGSGKSTTLLRTAREVLSQNPKAEILMLAFNKTIQQELQEKCRLQGLDTVQVKTLNGFGYSVIRNHFPDMALEPTWKRYGGYVARSLRARFHANFDQDKKTVLKLLALCKSYLIDHHSLNEVTRIATQYRMDPDAIKDLHPVLVEVIEWGLKEARRNQKIDFDDQCWLPVHLNLSVQPYDFVLIDECQDLTQVQLELVKRSIKTSGRMLFVGDEAQAIMGFRGADNQSVNNIRQLSPTEFPLSVSYRCPITHIQKAQQVFPMIQPAPSARMGTVQEIPWQHLSSHAGSGDLMFGRTRQTVRQAFYQLVRNGRKINFLQKALSKDDTEEAAGMTLQEATENLQELAIDIHQQAQHNSISYAEELGSRFTRSHASRNPSELGAQLYALQGLFRSRAFLTGEDFLFFLKHQLAPDPRGIMLCTAHQAKGLEAERVFVLSFEDFNVKDQRMLEWEHQQERNLWYVALTRARKELYLVRSFKA